MVVAVLLVVDVEASLLVAVALPEVDVGASLLVGELVVSRAVVAAAGLHPGVEGVGSRRGGGGVGVTK